MKKFCKDLREHATKLINYEKKDMIPLTKKKRNTIISEKFVTYAQKNLIQIISIKNTIKQKVIVIIRENIEVQLLIISVI